MASIAVFSAKGGSGASLVATNLAVLLARQGTALLLDANPGRGVDDLLLDLEAGRSWADLLPVAAELSDRHLSLCAARHPGGLALLAAPATLGPPASVENLPVLLQSLAARFDWLVVDSPGSDPILSSVLLAQPQVAVVVTTADPPALRSAHRLLDRFPAPLREQTGLVVNQIGRRHPASPAAIAESLGCALLASLPTDPRAVGYQVNFGQACVQDPRSPLGRALTALTRRLVNAVTHQPAGQADPHPAEPETTASSPASGQTP